MTFTALGRVRRPAFCALLGIALSALTTAKAATISTVATIPGANDGSTPYAALTKLDGKYYGTTSEGGSTGGNAGTVFRIDLKTGTETILHDFAGGSDGSAPRGRLTALSGKLYGTTIAGGSAGGGTVFAIDPASGAEQVIYNLPANSSPQGELVEFNGLLYGTGRNGGAANVGFIYSVDPAAATGQVVYSFAGDRTSGAYPSGLTKRNDALFGVTTNGGKSRRGTIFRFDPTTASLRLEHAFAGSGDGNEPLASLINVGGTLYGTTLYGGAHGYGTVFSFDPEGRTETVLHAFDYTDGDFVAAGLLSVGGLLYGVTESGGTHYDGVAFSVDPTNDQFNIIYQFGNAGGPSTGLVEANGLLYGTREYGGVAYEGEIYSIDPANGTFSDVYDFAGLETSTNSGLIKVNASLYGTASGGGARGLGSIYKVDPATGAVETLHSFGGADGARPMGALLEVNGLLYGTTFAGGSSGSGTLFSFGLANHKLTTLYQFTGGTDGGSPACALSLDDGVLYGTTQSGNGAPDGTLFNFDPSSGTFAVVFNFAGTGEYDPYSGVIPANGLLYGVAYGGYGSLYQFDPSTGKQTILYTFKGGEDGASPNGGLLYSNGLLFGSTASQRHVQATLFNFDPATATKTILHRFKSGESPTEPFVASGNKLFGIAYTSQAPYGAVLRLTTAGKGAQIYPFASKTGGYPDAPLLHVGQAYYGTTRSTGTANAGTVFKFLP